MSEGTFSHVSAHLKKEQTKLNCNRNTELKLSTVKQVRVLLEQSMVEHLWDHGNLFEIWGSSSL